MKCFRYLVPAVTAAAALAALAAPAGATTDTRLQAYAMEPLGNVDRDNTVIDAPYGMHERSVAIFVEQ